MPNWNELAGSIAQPFGGVGAMQPAPGADPNFKPTLDPVMVWNAIKAIGQYFGNQIKQPIQGTMDAARMGQYNLASGQGLAPNPMNPLAASMFGMGGGRGLTSGINWNAIKQAMEKIPKFKAGMGDTLSALRKQFPDMGKAEFDEMVLGLAREGKIALHQQDLPKGYKGEMIAVPSKRVGDGGKIIDSTDYYHYFSVKPEWR